MPDQPTHLTGVLLQIQDNSRPNSFIPKTGPIKHAKFKVTKQQVLQALKLLGLQSDPLLQAIEQSMASQYVVSRISGMNNLHNLGYQYEPLSKNLDDLNRQITAPELNLENPKSARIPENGERNLATEECHTNPIAKYESEQMLFESDGDEPEGDEPDGGEL